jgi:hypothetical protein
VRHIPRHTIGLRFSSASLPAIDGNLHTGTRTRHCPAQESIPLQERKHDTHQRDRPAVLLARGMEGGRDLKGGKGDGAQRRDSHMLGEGRRC